MSWRAELPRELKNRPKSRISSIDSSIISSIDSNVHSSIYANVMSSWPKSAEMQCVVDQYFHQFTHLNKQGGLRTWVEIQEGDWVD